MRIPAFVLLCLIALSACDELTPGAKAPSNAPSPAVPAWQTRPRPIALPKFDATGAVAHAGAKIWYAIVGQGAPVVLLHGAFGNAENFGNQVPALVKSGHRVILIDSRGHGRSTRDAQPFTYELMESDVIAVLDALKIDQTKVVGWSDGAIIGLIMAMKHPARVSRVFAFGANMDPNGVMPGVANLPIFSGLIEQATSDYKRLSPTPGEFEAFSDAMFKMLSTQPNYTAADLAKIKGPAIAIADGDHEEIIKRDYAAYLARSIPGARLVILPGVSHFAPVQNPAQFNSAMVGFLNPAVK